jgi:hypothetical protein
LRFWPFSWAIAHSLGFPGWFSRPMTLSTCLTHMTKNSFFLCLWPNILEFWGNLQGIWQSVHVWEAWPKTRHFYILGPFSWAIVHSFGFPRWFTRPVTLSLCLRGMTKNSSFLRFRAIFVSYCP